MKTHHIIVSILWSCFFLSCSQNEKKELQKEPKTISQVQSISKKVIDTTSVESDNIFSSDTINTVENYENNTSIKKKYRKKSVSNLKKERNKPEIVTTETPKFEDEKFKSFMYFRQMLVDCKIGQTLTQKQLMHQYDIPKEGIKLIKSITKVAEDEIAVKWRSTWVAEKFSDAKFTDATVKIRFEEDKMYTSGKAIGIKYNKKIYNDLIIIGSSAYIPSVKGFHWQIGK